MRFVVKRVVNSFLQLGNDGRLAVRFVLAFAALISATRIAEPHVGMTGEPLVVEPPGPLAVLAATVSFPMPSASEQVDGKAGKVGERCSATNKPSRIAATTGVRARAGRPWRDGVRGACSMLIADSVAVRRTVAPIPISRHRTMRLAWMARVAVDPIALTGTDGIRTVRRV